MCVSEKQATEFTLSRGQCHDAPEGRFLMETSDKPDNYIPLVMDRAYEDDLTRYTAQILNFRPIVPPKKNRKDPWDYDKIIYKLRNKIERLFRRLCGFRRIFCRFEKLDIMFKSFIQLALIFISFF